jgi:sugar O-acyltransferase (sialic acid O-acetyltransferase NeuD family)
MKKILGIFGVSGFAREVRDIANDIGLKTIFIARDLADLDSSVSDDEIILERDVVQNNDWQFAIGIGENAIRQRVAQRFGDQLHFANLIHPSATFGKGQREVIECSQGVIVCAGVRFTNNIKVGNFTIFNLNATIGHDSIIDDYASVSPGANISGNVVVGVRSWVGTGAAINQGVDGKKLIIGVDTVIGSGSVVVKDCESNSVYVGIPAKRIK